MSSPLSAFAQYRILPSLASRPWLTSALAARAPFAMLPLGVMTSVTASTGSVALGGLATGISTACGAVAAPLLGRWADHTGQRTVLGTLIPLNTLALVLLLVLTLMKVDNLLLWAVCILLGVTTVPIGSFTRAHWASLTRNPRELSTAFSYESTVDELTFVLGPALVGLTASAFFPSAPVALAAVLALIGGIPFALTSPTKPRPEKEPDTTTGDMVAIPPIPTVLLAVLPAMVVMLCIGINFGSVQAATTERAALLGAEGAGGLVYALMGVGSAATALAVVMVPDAVRLSTRVLVGGLGMALALVAAASADGLLSTALLLLVVGLFLGPTMVTAFSIAERRSPRGGISVAMTTIQGSVTVGVSAGAMIGGALAASAGPVGAFGFAIAAGVVIVLVGLVGRLRP